MLYVVKTTNLINKRMALLCGFLFLAILTLPFLAQAQCSGWWYAGGEWVLMQKGQRYGFDLKLRQDYDGRVITGTALQAEYTGTKFLTDRQEFRKVDGTVDGTIDGDSFSVQIFWNNGQTGVYIAKVLPSGRLDGEGYEKSSPNVRVPWHSQGVLTCVPPRRPVIPKPIKSSGKAKPAPQTPAPPPPTPPFITAGQAIIPTPTHPFGIVPLSWDGGPDHPNVEVWLSKDNAAEIPAFSMEQGPQSPVWKQPKISIALQLQRYHHYRFVLKDAGKTLSTAAFVVP